MEGGEHSEAAIDAAVDLTKAHQDAEIAAKKFGLEGGPAAIEAFRIMAAEAGLDADAIQRVIDAMTRANQTPFNPRRAGELEDAYRPSTRSPAWRTGLPRRALHGRRGRPGKRSSRPRQAGSFRHSRGRTSTPMNITINAGMGSDPNAISRAVVEALQRYQRTTGPSRSGHVS